MNPLLIIRQGSASYPVFTGRDLLGNAGSLVKPRGQVFVITSTALRERFGEPVARSFTPAATILTIEEGEANKTLATASDVLTHLLDHGAKRDSMAVVVGGGMLGDTAGFAASIFLRGIDLVHVPTTLLAQIDSSIGGKLAVNHPKGKNLIGSFYFPRAVIADTGLLTTLPRRELLSGIFEALKGGVIADPVLFELIELRRREMLDLDPATIDEVVQRAILVKAGVVSLDAKEGDLRRLLNYGHTIGHGIEAALGYEGLTHGEAVAWGMIGANAIAVARRFLDPAVRDRIDAAIRSYEPAPLPSLDRDAILAAAAHDKKNTGWQRVMVMPRAIGDCTIVADISEREIGLAIDAIL